MIRITRPGKYALSLNSPVMTASGVMGFANAYYNIIDISKLGAYVTNPITYAPWSPATGTRVVPIDAGVLLHTGLPNPGLSRTIKEYKAVWRDMDIPVIAHLVATEPDHIEKAVRHIDSEETLMAIELGLDDDISRRDAEHLVKTAKRVAEKPIIVRLPVSDAYELAYAVSDAGADALVLTAPPRGTARDPRSGRLVSGRIYSPVVKAMVLRLVGVLASQIDDIPIIGAGGIHSTQDARDYLEAGAVAVQLDSVTWIKPQIVERIARDLGGSLVTRKADAFPDEWHPDMGDTEFRQLFSDDNDDTDIQSDDTASH